MAKEEEVVMIDVITTERGTFGTEGIAPIGTHRSIPVGDFSKNWMRPKAAKDAKAIQAMIANLKAEAE